VNTTNSLSSTGSNLISRLGNGSGVDTASLIQQLTELSSAPQAQRLETRKTQLETQISDLGLLRSSLAKVQTSVAALASRETFDAKTLALPNTSLLTINKLEASAAAGNYTLKIEQIAQSQSLSSGNFSSLTDPIGKGTLTLRFGNWNEDLDTFEVNSNRVGANIVIDDTNNTLSGLRDAINNAGIGVQASIVSDGEGNFKLLLTGPSGANNELEIVAEEEPGFSGLSQFEFHAGAQFLTQVQEGRDAQLRVNGLLVSRETNRITDVIPGLEFDLFNSSTTETVSINVAADRSVAEQAIRDFIDTYNTFLTEVKQLVGFNSERGENGSLARDSVTNNLLRSLRTAITGAIPGIENGGFDALAAFGIRTELDGSLKIIEDNTNTDFRAAINNHFDKLANFFAPKTGSSDSRIDVTAYGARTKPGNYEVVITQEASKGQYVAGELTSLDTTGKDYGFTILVNGVLASPISLPADKVYASGDELAADLQSLINLDPALKAAGASVNVAYNSDTNQLEFISTAFGAQSRVEFIAVGGDAEELGIAIGAGTAGTDVAGTVNGVAAFGYGNVLLPALGSDAEGLSMIIAPGATTATINFSRGLAGQLESLINDFVKNSGLISNREETINKDLKRVDDDKQALDRRTEAYRARLQAQFLAMESIVRSLNSTGSFLDGLADRLPFTAKQS
jgi:flagellar hook-associated protein 2